MTYILKELGITLWKLRCPVLLKNKKSIRLYVNLRFLLISNLPLSLDDLFIKDVACAIQIHYSGIYIIKTDEIADLILPDNFSCHCWWIGANILRNFHGVCLKSPVLSVLKHDTQAKRDLWNQIVNQFELYNTTKISNL